MQKCEIKMQQNFNLAFSQYSSICQAFDGQTEFS